MIHFRYSTSDQSSTGGIVVHLHHTAHRVQVQGSSMVNRRVRANVWFVEHFLLENFNKMSQVKSFDISKLNSAVTKMVSNHIEKLSASEQCDYCMGLFNGRSVNEQCSKCSKRLHKKCNVDHVCVDKQHQTETTQQQSTKL